MKNDEIMNKKQGHVRGVHNNNFYNQPKGN